VAISLASLSKGTVVRAPRILLLGVEKIGKTSFGCGVSFEKGKVVKVGQNSPVVIPCLGEEGADSIGVPMFPACSTFEEMMESITALYVEDHKFRTVVIDSASALGPIICDAVCKEFDVDSIRKVPGFRTGEASVLNRWRDILGGLDGLRNSKGMASIVIGHVKVKKHKNPEGDDYDTYDIDLEHTDVSELLKRWADVILFAQAKIAVKKDGEDKGIIKAKRRGVDTGLRCLYTQKRPAHPGGGRGAYGQLPYELPLDWGAFEAALADAINNKTQPQEEEE
jgi:hypothetical protein